MNFNVKISTEINENEWNNNLAQSTTSTVYQTSNWQKLYHEAFGSKPIFITVINNDDIVVGQLACLIHEKMLWEDANPITKTLGNIFKLATSLWWYGGPIIHDKNHEEEILSVILSSIEKIVKDYKVVNIRGISSPFMEQFNSKIFEKYGYNSERKLTFIIDLTQNLDELYSTLKKDTRYYIRKSEKEGFEFDISKDMEGLRKLQDFKIEAKKRAGIKPILDREFYKKHWKIMHGSGFEEVLLARDEGEVKGTILTLFFNGNMIQHALANSPDKELVGTFLTWNTIKWAQKMKFRTFDFAGVDPQPKTKKEKGIYFYAEKFGGQKVDLFSYTKIINRKKFYLTSGLKNPKKIVSKYQSYKLKKNRKMDV